MADDQDIVRGVSWSEVFAFTHIFKSFKMAIHPSKLLLALVAIVLTCAVGRVMDPIWSAASDSSVVMKGEAWTFWTAESRADFLQQKQTWLETTRVDNLAGLMDAEGIEEPAKLAKDDFAGAADTLKDKYRQQYETQTKEAEANPAALAAYVERKKVVDGWQGKGIFAGFLEWEMHCVSNALGAVRRGNITTGLSDLYLKRGKMTPGAYRQTAVPNVPGTINASTNDPEGVGLLGWLVLGLWGLWWMFATYWLYAVVFGLIALAIWSVVGGAICRIAALHAAREERIGIGAAVKFSLSKFFSFFSAPLVPLGFIVFLGLCMAIAGLVGAIPYVGEWLFVVLFALCLIAGAISAFLIIGLAAGGPLMWPTIAVEGSDSFDALSRSFSYVWQYPFRYGLYWLIAAVYGTICYLFVRLFAFLSLRSVHLWASWWMGAAGREEYALGAGKLDAMWPQPTFESFHGPMQTEAMIRWEEPASWVLALLVYLVLGVVLAFLATFFFSAATNIYYLLRRRMEATDLDDVYIEEEPEAEEAPPGEAAPVDQPPEEQGPEGDQE